ncbi:(2Fe-2S)-binding protein [Streptomyces sp. SAJ15]|uniref:(2Fe-2S)-binding protein n=1 Tax=Streptomyces sp. SAJ15 TaxID=2011095 RepID=UPI001187027B|nr:(2Fe-2S)-binding protein [Streptomyces sp. SAJ15]TVL89472.1 ferric iron reductase [Streptomyces sp. SAJ15]
MTPDEALRRAAGAGPFFAVRLGAGAPDGPRGEGYVRLAEVYGPGEASPAYAGDGADAAGSPETADAPGALDVSGVSPALLARLDAVGTSLRVEERRVAASLAFQGLAARLWSIALGPAALTGLVPDLSPGALWWNPARTAPDDLWLPEPRPLTVDPVLAAASLRQTVLLANLTPLHHATRVACRVSGPLLWGNAASALAGTLRVWQDWCHRGRRPDAADRAAQLTRDLFADPPLRDTGGWTPGPRPSFRRNSCCLYYRVPGGGLCGDCALRSR